MCDPSAKHHSDSVDVKLGELREVILENLSYLGLSAAESQIVADVLLYAELRDKSQGVIKILEKSVAPDPQRQPIEVDARSAAIHLIHASGHVGMVALDNATTVTIDACRRCGLALTGTRGTASSTGCIGYYADRIAQAGYIGIVMAGSPKVMAVTGSRCAAMGTNPLAIAIPTTGEPLLLDMATAATTWFDLLQAARDKTPVPQGVALDNQGNPTVDAAAALEGVLLTFGDNRGSGLALMLEMLTGPLMGAAVVGDDEDSRGNFILAIDPAMLAADFTQKVEQILDAIHTGPLQAGFDHVRLPGEHAAALARTRLQAGCLPVNREIFQALKANCHLPG